MYFMGKKPLKCHPSKGYHSFRHVNVWGELPFVILGGCTLTENELLHALGEERFLIQYSNCMK